MGSATSSGAGEWEKKDRAWEAMTGGCAGRDWPEGRVPLGQTGRCVLCVWGGVGGGKIHNVGWSQTSVLVVDRFILGLCVRVWIAHECFL